MEFGKTMVNDIRHAVRNLRKAPAFAGAVIATLAVAIGANTAIFSVVRAALLQPLPYKNPARLFCVWHGDENQYSWYTFSYPRFLFFSEHAKDLAELAAYDDETVTVSGSDEPIRVEGGRVSANFFPVLGVKPALGRNFMPSEDRHGAAPAAMLSYGFWQRRYNSNRHILGRTIAIDDQEYTIVGVLPRGFEFQGQPVDVWRSRMIDTRTFAPASVALGASYLTVIARLHPNVELSQFRAKLALLGAEYSRQNASNSDILGPVSADLLQRKLFAPIHGMLLVLWGSVVCLFVIACANVANLVLARAGGRHGDIGVRYALGASRWRIAQQLISESLVLSICGAFVSLPLSSWGTHSLVSALQSATRSMPDVHLSASVMLFTVGVAILAGVALGVAPLWIFRRDTARTGLRSQSRSFTTSNWTAQFRNVLVVSQVALSVVLLAAAGLLTSSFIRMTTMSTGLRTDHVWVCSLDLMPDRYQSWQSRAYFYDGVLRNVQAVPGITAAGITSRVELVGNGLGYMIQPQGSPDLGSRNPSAKGRSVSPDYFGVLGIPLLRGRRFTEHDTVSSKRVMIVNQTFAKTFFPGQDPVGKHVIYSTDRIDCEIVGVVADVRNGLDEAGAEKGMYLPLSQRPWLVAHLVVRTPNPAGIVSAIRRSIRAVDPGQAVATSYSLDQAVSESVGRPRTAMFVVVLFASAALLLAGVGIYGVIAYSVSQRKKEIGIRMALGADGARVRSLVFVQTFRLLGLGALIGIPLAIVSSRLYTSLLFEARVEDPLTFSVVLALLLAVALIATYGPALRASRVDPATVLHSD